MSTIINSAGLKRLGRNKDGKLRSPLSVMTGIIPNQLIARIMPYSGHLQTAVTIFEANARRYPQDQLFT